jgi:hypothetical protein
MSVGLLLIPMRRNKENFSARLNSSTEDDWPMGWVDERQK